MSHVVVALAGLAGGLVLALAFGLRRRRTELRRGPRRILFPFVGASLSQSALESALRIARAEEATLVPVFLASVPLHSPMEVALPRQCGVALPLLEAIEHRATGAGIAVDARIERGRTHRHALRGLVESEPFDRIVVAVETGSTSGFSPDDIAWLLREAPGEIVVLRPAGGGAVAVPDRVPVAARLTR